MHLKSLTLRGFKSFADKTSLAFEPGITVIVGPNGSGKSNVVDALTWVLGASSAKSLRGGSMADVIFAGAPGRAALGRAQVEITIDNADQSLPIDFTEVAVSRTIFASGENAYAVNDEDCRALDVAELLSDTGLGREHHTIVGQGQLDAVLNARPEDRRAFIEEAAGILKHRKRKERALRKIAQTEAHVERLTDLLRELKRNLRPLERQAQAAQQHAELRRALREVRVLRAVRELDALDRRWGSEVTAQEDSDGRLSALEAALRDGREREASLERELGRLSPAVRAIGETHFRLANLVERYRGLGERIEERRTGLVEAVEEPVAGRDPDELRTRAGRLRAGLEDVAQERDAAATALGAAEAARQAAEQARRAHAQAVADAARRRAQEREARLRWEGEVAALRSRLGQAGGEQERLASQVEGLRQRRGACAAELEAATADAATAERDLAAHAERLADAQADMAVADDERTAAGKEERELDRRRASLEARVEALRSASRTATEGAAALLDAADAGKLAGVLGPLPDRVAVADGMGAALSAALGALGEAVVVDGRVSAALALQHVRAGDGGRVVLLPAERVERPEGPAPDGGAQAGEDAGWDGGAEHAGNSALDARDGALAAEGARPAVDSLRADGAGLADALTRALAGTYTVADLDTACRLASRHPDCTFVTVDGEVAGPGGYAAGSTGGGGVVARAAADEAAAALEELEEEVPAVRRRLEAAEGRAAEARAALATAERALQELRSASRSAGDRLARARDELAACERQLGVASAQADDLRRQVADQQARLDAVAGREPALPDAEEPDPAERASEADRLDAELAAAREQEVQARLGVGAVEQRGAELARQADALEQEADEVERRLAERERRRVRRLAAIERCAALATVAADALAQAESSLAVAAAERARLEEERGARQRDLAAARAVLRERGDELAALRDARHAEELRRAELQHAVQAVHVRLVDELAIAEPERLLERARAGSIGGADDEPPLGGGEERDAALAEEEERLTRKLGLLGTINPLALEEFAALEERHRFLAEQLEDLSASRKDLLEVVAAVDARIEEVFAAAFADVAEHFGRIFPQLFPGGEGRLVLTDPDDMLGTGVEVEARPAGKRVKRLSLLSGGERSLTALAVLFAIFAARPSPFYVLDEVEAALDDVNLQRFLAVVKEFRASSQLIIVSHQKRTMEIADTLYGVTMQGDGVSKVIAQRVEDRVAATVS